MKEYFTRTKIKMNGGSKIEEDEKEVSEIQDERIRLEQEERKMKVRMSYKEREVKIKEKSEMGKDVSEREKEIETDEKKKGEREGREVWEERKENETRGREDGALPLKEVIELDDIDEIMRVRDIEISKLHMMKKQVLKRINAICVGGMWKKVDLKQFGDKEKEITELRSISMSIHTFIAYCNKEIREMMKEKEKGKDEIDEAEHKMFEKLLFLKVKEMVIRTQMKMEKGINEEDEEAKLVLLRRMVIKLERFKEKIMKEKISGEIVDEEEEPEKKERKKKSVKRKRRREEMEEDEEEVEEEEAEEEEKIEKERAEEGEGEGEVG
jgi:hypothetical protein